ncbi:uncharacterized protein LOC135096160 isoform X3 [Scylla paramamosain]|uniref:uncharacterized protein LOC135096160 isoform X3 n=1 Tax=Scylla paramamosain TaxID=85552 RepID=UPI003082839C
MSRSRINTKIKIHWRQKSFVYSVSGGGNRGGVPVVLWSVVRSRRVCGRLRLCLSWPGSPVATWSPVYSVSGGGNRGGVPVVLWSVVRARRVCGRLRLCLSWPGSPVATWSSVYSVSGGGNRGGVLVVLWSVVRARRVCGRLRLCLSWPGSPVATWRTGGASLASPEGVQDSSGETARTHQQVHSAPDPSGQWPASPPVHSAPEPLGCQVGVQRRDSLRASSAQAQGSCRTGRGQEQCCNGGCDVMQQQQEQLGAAGDPRREDLHL